MTARAPTRLALRGDLLDFTATPGWADTGLRGVRWREDHWLLIEDGRIVGAQLGSQAPDASWTRQVSFLDFLRSGEKDIDAFIKPGKSKAKKASISK